MSNPANVIEPANASAAASESKDPAAEIENRTANDNAPAPPIVVLHPTGEGALLYRALARVLVRRELKSASAIPANDDCDAAERTG